MHRRTALKLSLIAAASPILFMSNVQANEGKGPTFVDNKGRAIRGYDTVAYFTENKAVKGESNFTYEWKHGTWYFSSQANLELFKANPEKYAPQYGGYCAYTVAIDKLVPIDPTQFTILEDKLYLNYSPRFQRRWNKNRAGYLADSEKNWPALIAKINANYKS